MQPIGKKVQLTEQELLEAVEYFDLGKLISHELIKKGNINSNYLVISDKGKYIIRLYAFKTKEEIISERELLLFLSKNNFPCPVPTKIEYEKENKIISCFSYIEGKQLKKVGDKEIKEIGKLLARLHSLTDDYKMKYEREGEGLEVIKRYVKEKGEVILKSEFRKSSEFISFLNRELAKFRFPDSLPGGVAHADAKAENIIKNKDGGLSLIDFDNSYEDKFVIDIGSSIMWLCLEDNNIMESKMNRFLEAYEEIRKITKQEREYLIEAVLFNCLKQAFKYAYICLPNLKFAEDNAYNFLDIHKNINKKYDRKI